MVCLALPTVLNAAVKGLESSLVHTKTHCRQTAEQRAADSPVPEAQTTWQGRERDISENRLSNIHKYPATQTNPPPQLLTLRVQLELVSKKGSEQLK